MTDRDPANPEKSQQKRPVENEAAQHEKKQLAAFMSPLKSMELQIGEHVFEALQQEDTVAVLSVVSSAAGQQRIVSVPLDQNLLKR